MYTINVNKFEGSPENTRDYLCRDCFDTVSEAETFIEEHSPIIECDGYVYSISDEKETVKEGVVFF